MESDVEQYIGMKKNVLANMRALQDMLYRLQWLGPEVTPAARSRTRNKIQRILDDPFTAHGSTQGS